MRISEAAQKNQIYFHEYLVHVRRSLAVLGLHHKRLLLVQRLFAEVVRADFYELEDDLHDLFVFFFGEHQVECAKVLEGHHIVWILRVPYARVLQRELLLLRRWSSIDCGLHRFTSKHPVQRDSNEIRHLQPHEVSKRPLSDRLK